MKKSLHTRAIPLLSVFSAFCFVIMMFNIPLPGGTTGHAVGMGAASIVLGPWASILAISVALLVQAFLFGDGGITALGANCFNMAIVGSLASYFAYKLFSYRAGLLSGRRVFAAGLAGYVGINAAALIAAVEFGMQPVLFHDASGTPLYAPYPLNVALPAMMIGHLTLAGLAEFVISAGIVAWLQRVDPQLLRLTSPGAATSEVAPNPRLKKQLWVGLAALILITPLGILAVGSAWGEWTPQDFGDASTRTAIAAASSNHAAPQVAPAGLTSLSTIWSAPLARYAPAFVHNESLGYLFSAILGAAVIALLGALVRWKAKRSSQRATFAGKTVQALLGAIQRSVFAEDIALSRGFLQQLDPRVKLTGIAALIIATVSVHKFWVLTLLFALTILLALFSQVSLHVLATRVWLPVLAFSGFIALPALFLVSGEVLLRIPVVGWTVTYQGVRSAGFLLLRAETSAAFSVLLILTTLWTQLLRSLRFFRLPAVLVVIVGMTYRYIFLLLRTAAEMFEAREARLVGTLAAADQRRLAAGSAGVLLGKTMQLTGDVHMAMQARGFRGEVRLLHEPNLRTPDWLHLAGLAGIAFCAVWWGR